MVYKIFHKNSLDTGIKCEIMPNQLLAEVLHKPVLRQVIKRKMYSSFEYKIRGVDLTDMRLISNLLNIRKNIFACLFSVHNTISLSRHEQVRLIRLSFKKYLSHHRAT